MADSADEQVKKMDVLYELLKGGTATKDGRFEIFLRTVLGEDLDSAKIGRIMHIMAEDQREVDELDTRLAAGSIPRSEWYGTFSAIKRSSLQKINSIISTEDFYKLFEASLEMARHAFASGTA